MCPPSSAGARSRIDPFGNGVDTPARPDHRPRLGAAQRQRDCNYQLAEPETRLTKPFQCRFNQRLVARLFRPTAGPTKQGLHYTFLATRLARQNLAQLPWGCEPSIL